MKKVQKLIKELTEKENITEELKDSNQMLWISKMNSIDVIVISNHINAGGGDGQSVTNIKYNN